MTAPTGLTGAAASFGSPMRLEQSTTTTTTTTTNDNTNNDMIIIMILIIIVIIVIIVTTIILHISIRALRSGGRSSGGYSKTVFSHFFATSLWS